MCPIVISVIIKSHHRLSTIISDYLNPKLFESNVSVVRVTLSDVSVLSSTGKVFTFILREYFDYPVDQYICQVPIQYTRD